MKKTTLFIVDDHHLIVDAIQAYLLGNEKYQLLGSASNPSELLDFLNRKQPDILILDVKLPGMQGPELALSIKDKYPGIKIIFLSSNTDKQTIDKAIKAGGVGYLSKDITEQEFITALDKISQGNTYYSQNIQQIIFDGFTQAIKSTKDTLPLSEREIEIIKYFAEGFSYKEIAERLFISTRTVEAHKRNIMDKLNLKTTVDLVKFAIKNGIVTL